MLKKNIILLLVIQYVLFSCFFITEPFRKYEQEYNPQKAGADIAAKIILSSKPRYISYSNSHCYILNDNNISVYDLTNDQLSLNYTIPFNITTAYCDESGDYSYSINKCSGLLVEKNKISCVLSVIKLDKRNKDEKKYFWDVLSVKYDAQSDKYSDVTSDKSNFPINNLDYNQTYWYDNSDDILYAGIYGYNTVDSVTQIIKYQYSAQTESYKKKDTIEFFYDSKYKDYSIDNEMFLTDKLFLYYVCYYESTSGWSESYLTIYPNYNIQRSKNICLDYLHLSGKPYSAFADNNGDIWLYRYKYDEKKKQDKYELLKLKLLE